MNKFGFVIGLIIAIGAMLLIPSPIGQVAKASTCSSSGAIHGTSHSFSSTTSGSCSTASVSSVGGSISFILPHGGSKSSCSAISTAQSFPTVSSQDSNGAVSCSAHSP